MLNDLKKGNGMETAYCWAPLGPCQGRLRLFKPPNTLEELQPEPGGSLKMSRKAFTWRDRQRRTTRFCHAFGVQAGASHGSRWHQNPTLQLSCQDVPGILAVTLRGLSVRQLHSGEWNPEKHII